MGVEICKIYVVSARKVRVEDIQSRKQSAELEIYIGLLDTCECYSSSQVSSRFENASTLLLRNNHGKGMSNLPKPVTYTFPEALYIHGNLNLA